MRSAFQHDVVVAFAELVAMGIERPHVNSLRQHMINCGFDRDSARDAIGDAVGLGLLIYIRRREHVTLRMESWRGFRASVSPLVSPFVSYEK